MNEQLLQFIWQSGYFNKTSLQTTSGEDIQIVHPGTLNTNQGPDFKNAKIRIAQTLWAGSVELHVKTSDWEKHRHGDDQNYKNVILHVVYENDSEHSAIPVLELRTAIPKTLLNRYRDLMASQRFIPCESMAHLVTNIILESWKARLVAERLTRKMDVITRHLAENKSHWEATFWWLLARNFGGKVNGDSFEAVAKSISVNILAKHKHQLNQLEALLLGQAGLLQHDFKDAYPQMLRKEYEFLKAKYDLPLVHQPVQFLRMRPANFPTIRLAQLAALVQRSVHLFSKIIEEPEIKVAQQWLKTCANDYWHYHYKPDDVSFFRVKTLGADMVENIIINTIVPALFAYGTMHQNQGLKSRALQWLEELRPEQNSNSRGFRSIGWVCRNAFDSQALLELKTQYCDVKKCLHCAVGNSLLKRT